MQIAVIGRGDSVIGFTLAGIRKAYETASEDELISKIEEVMADPEVGDSRIVASRISTRFLQG